MAPERSDSPFCTWDLVVASAIFSKLLGSKSKRNLKIRYQLKITADRYSDHDKIAWTFLVHYFIHFFYFTSGLCFNKIFLFENWNSLNYLSILALHHSEQFETICLTFLSTRWDNILNFTCRENLLFFTMSHFINSQLKRRNAGFLVKVVPMNSEAVTVCL